MRNIHNQERVISKKDNSIKIDNRQLKRLVTDGNDTYETLVIPRSLISQVLHMAHDNLGHNGTHRTYILIKRLYYWKGIETKRRKTH